MPERRKRKKSEVSSSAKSQRRKPRRARPSFPTALGDLDLRTLVVLSVGEWWELGDHEWPPERVCRWLEQADIQQLRGVLLATLERWHEVCQHEPPPP